jgi:hypothetical protein
MSADLRRKALVKVASTRSPSGPSVEEIAVELLVVIVVVGALVAGFIRARRSRGNVMGYHDIETPRVNQTRRGGRGDDDGGGGG